MAIDVRDKPMRLVTSNEGFSFLAGQETAHNHPCIFAHGGGDRGQCLTVLGRDGTRQTFDIDDFALAIACYNRCLQSNNYHVPNVSIVT